jgi:hypothetical protein
MKDVVTGILDYCRHGIIKLHELYRELYALCEGATGEILTTIMYRGHRYRPVAVKEYVSLYRRGSRYKRRQKSIACSPVLVLAIELFDRNAST